MKPELKVIIYEQRKLFRELLNLLDEQYDLILGKDVKLLEKVAKKLENASRNVAKLEIQRRNIVGSDFSMGSLIEESDDKNIKEAYEEIKQTIKMIEIQKESNDVILKQKLFFNKKMLNVLKPSQGIGTYNYSGQLGK
ncbi:flgN family protein [[Clostridium] bifermentans ATCC 638]|uniref:FlgN family protein n=1 Tax=Paraclostridium bifermentans ATCC 638 = DSM 14991 TaxID=1233171 RepID=T4VRB4_PARBF|nr:flagellar protein FlgN [Paraclostridium bifermentans]EQK43640.1 flgN family protein [[Clostridium] bifermentans ATCC 638] [Paraclostridium bifermentans ATCC 638 = DSM 14991]UAG17483.1 flagellar protein FlgN [Paraclostridium bifermentans]